MHGDRARRCGRRAGRVAAALLVAGLAAALPARPAAAASQQLTAPAPNSPVFVAFTNEFDGTSTTDFSVTAESQDHSSLLYIWSLPVVQCGRLVDTTTRTSRNGYFHGPTTDLPEGCPPPPGAEIDTIVQVLVIRSVDWDAHAQAPKSEAPYFVYKQVARAGDSPATEQYAKDQSLTYFGGPVGQVERTPTPVIDGLGTSAASEFPVAPVALGGLLALGAAVGTVLVVRRREHEDEDGGDDERPMTMEEKQAYIWDTWDGEYHGGNDEYSFVQGARQDLLNPDYGPETKQIRIWIISIYEEAYKAYRQKGFSHLVAHAMAHIKVDEWKDKSLDQFEEMFATHIAQLGSALSADALGNVQKLVAEGVPATAVKFGTKAAAKGATKLVSQGETAVGTEARVAVTPPNTPNTTYFLGQDVKGVMQGMKLVKKPGVFDVVIHGRPGGFLLKIGGKEIPISPKTFVDALRKSGYEGGPVRLIACDTGSQVEGAAQQVADLLGETVEAPTGKVWVDQFGNPSVFKAYKHPTQGWIRTGQGQMQQFHPTLPATPGQ